MSPDSGPDATPVADTDGSADPTREVAPDASVGDTDAHSEADADPEVDAVDRRLVDALLSDGRAGTNDLASAAGVPTEVARNRRERLEEAGVIEGYRPVVDYGTLGYEMTAVFRFDVTGTGLETVVGDLRDTGEMVAVYEVTGDDDVVAIGKFADTGDLDATVKTLLAHRGVDGLTTDVVLEVVTEDAPLPVVDVE